MRLIVTGGGTGGHIYPAIAIADKFRAEDINTEVLYVGCHEGIEKEIVPKSGYRLELVDARWINKSNPYQLAKTAVRVGHGIMGARKVIKEFKPDAIIGTGGYVCFPVIFAGQSMGIPCYIHEQNAFPGLANRRLEKYVEKVFLGFGAASEYFSDKSKLVECGNPVRKAFFTLKKDEARAKLGFSQDEFIVLSFGGSLGSEKINEVAFDLMKELNGAAGASMVFGTGKWYYEDVLKRVSDEKIHVESNVKIMDYISDMDNYLMAADLVISRAGALSVAETMVCGKASILVPSPNVTGNHQYYNAKAVADRGGAILIEEKDLTGEKLVSEVKSLMEDKVRLEEMGRCARACAPVKALDTIYREVKAKLG